MEQEGISIGRVILTGSASKMPVVPEIVKEVFSDIPESALFFDMDPSRTISKGLALVGPSNDKSVSFQMDVSKVLREDVPRVVKNNVANLAASLSNFLSGKMESMMISHIKAWRNGDFATFNDMNKAIMEDCRRLEDPDGLWGRIFRNREKMVYRRHRKGYCGQPEGNL